MSTRMKFITTYLTAEIDPQRGIKWDSKLFEVFPLAQSVNFNLTIIHDEEIGTHEQSPTKFIKVKPIPNPYFARWIHILNNLPKFGYVCILDATDTEVINMPEPKNPDTIYVGHEQSTVGSKWMTENLYTDYLKPFIDENSDKQLLNCGVIVGHVSIVRYMIEEMIKEFQNDVGHIDMGAFNKVMYEKFSDMMEYGNHITTQFKKYEFSNQRAWIRHK